MIFSAPFTPDVSYLETLPLGVPHAVYHGPTAFIPLTYDPYAAPKRMGIFREIGGHPYQHVNAGEIVQRILKSREAFEERQRSKMKKAVLEKEFKQKEKLGRGELQSEHIDENGDGNLPCLHATELVNTSVNGMVRRT